MFYLVRLRFEDNDLVVNTYNEQTLIRTDRKFTDPSAWYHIVCGLIDTTQWNRFKQS